MPYEKCEKNLRLFAEKIKPAVPDEALFPQPQLGALGFPTRRKIATLLSRRSNPPCCPSRQEGQPLYQTVRNGDFLRRR